MDSVTAPRPPLRKDTLPPSRKSYFSVFASTSSMNSEFGSIASSDYMHRPSVEAVSPPRRSNSLESRDGLTQRLSSGYIPAVSPAAGYSPRSIRSRSPRFVRRSLSLHGISKKAPPSSSINQTNSAFIDNRSVSSLDDRSIHGDNISEHELLLEIEALKKSMERAFSMQRTVGVADSKFDISGVSAIINAITERLSHIDSQVKHLEELNKFRDIELQNSVGIEINAPYAYSKNISSGTSYRGHESGNLLSIVKDGIESIKKDLNQFRSTVGDFLYPPLSEEKYNDPDFSFSQMMYSFPKSVEGSEKPSEKSEIPSQPLVENFDGIRDIKKGDDSDILFIPPYSSADLLKSVQHKETNFVHSSVLRVEKEKKELEKKLELLRLEYSQQQQELTQLRSEHDSLEKDKNLARSTLSQFQTLLGHVQQDLLQEKTIRLELERVLSSESKTVFLTDSTLSSSSLTSGADSHVLASASRITSGISQELVVENDRLAKQLEKKTQELLDLQAEVARAMKFAQALQERALGVPDMGSALFPLPPLNSSLIPQETITDSLESQKDESSKTKGPSSIDSHKNTPSAKHPDRLYAEEGAILAGITPASVKELLTQCVDIFRLNLDCADAECARVREQFDTLKRTAIEEVRRLRALLNAAERSNDLTDLDVDPSVLRVRAAAGDEVALLLQQSDALAAKELQAAGKSTQNSSRSPARAWKDKSAIGRLLHSMIALEESSVSDSAPSNSSNCSGDPSGEQQENWEFMAVQAFAGLADPKSTAKAIASALHLPVADGKMVDESGPGVVTVSGTGSTIGSNTNTNSISNVELESLQAHVVDSELRLLELRGALAEALRLRKGLQSKVSFLLESAQNRLDEAAFASLKTELDALEAAENIRRDARAHARARATASGGDGEEMQHMIAKVQDEDAEEEIQELEFLRMLGSRSQQFNVGEPMKEAFELDDRLIQDGHVRLSHARLAALLCAVRRDERESVLRDVTSVDNGESDKLTHILSEKSFERENNTLRAQLTALVKEWESAKLSLQLLIEEAENSKKEALDTLTISQTDTARETALRIVSQERCAVLESEFQAEKQRLRQENAENEERLLEFRRSQESQQATINALHQDIAALKQQLTDTETRSELKVLQAVSEARASLYSELNMKHAENVKAAVASALKQQESLNAEHISLAVEKERARLAALHSEALKNALETEKELAKKSLEDAVSVADSEGYMRGKAEATSEFNVVMERETGALRSQFEEKRVVMQRQLDEFKKDVEKTRNEEASEFQNSTAALSALRKTHQITVDELGKLVKHYRKQLIDQHVTMRNKMNLFKMGIPLEFVFNPSNLSQLNQAYGNFIGFVNVSVRVRPTYDQISELARLKQTSTKSSESRKPIRNEGEIERDLANTMSKTGLFDASKRFSASSTHGQQKKLQRIPSDIHIAGKRPSSLEETQKIRQKQHASYFFEAPNEAEWLEYINGGPFPSNAVFGTQESSRLGNQNSLSLELKAGTNARSATRKGARLSDSPITTYKDGKLSVAVPLEFYALVTGGRPYKNAALDAIRSASIDENGLLHTGEIPHPSAVSNLNNNEIVRKGGKTKESYLKEYVYEFDSVFSPASTQEDVFDEILPMVNGAVEGINGCVMAYGQTGSGKTYTMDGSDSLYSSLESPVGLELDDSYSGGAAESNHSPFDEAAGITLKSLEYLFNETAKRSVAFTKASSTATAAAGLLANRDMYYGDVKESMNPPAQQLQNIACDAVAAEIAAEYATVMENFTDRDARRVNNPTLWNESDNDEEENVVDAANKLKNLYTFHISILEVYQERVYDLLAEHEEALLLQFDQMTDKIVYQSRSANEVVHDLMVHDFVDFAHNDANSESDGARRDLRVEGAQKSREELLDNSISGKTATRTLRGQPLNASFMNSGIDATQVFLDRASSKKDAAPKVQRQLLETNSGVEVPGVVRVKVRTLGEALTAIRRGTSSRRTAAHKLNEKSSRSHLIVKIELDGPPLPAALSPDAVASMALFEDAGLRISSKRVDQKANLPGSVHNIVAALSLLRNARRSSFIQFVDLAGAEKIEKSKATGEVLKDATFINASLGTLGACIAARNVAAQKLAQMNALSNSVSAATMNRNSIGVHIPFRDSKLTFLLKDVLTGRARVHLLACVSSDEADLLETIHTLNFAKKCSSITSHIDASSISRGSIPNINVNLNENSNLICAKCRNNVTSSFTSTSTSPANTEKPLNVPAKPVHDSSQVEHDASLKSYVKEDTQSKYVNVGNEGLATDRIFSLLRGSRGRHMTENSQRNVKMSFSNPNADSKIPLPSFSVNKKSTVTSTTRKTVSAVPPSTEGLQQVEEPEISGSSSLKFPAEDMGGNFSPPLGHSIQKSENINFTRDMASPTLTPADLESSPDQFDDVEEYHAENYFTDEVDDFDIENELHGTDDEDAEIERMLFERLQGRSESHSKNGGSSQEKDENHPFPRSVHNSASIHIADQSNDGFLSARSDLHGRSFTAENSSSKRFMDTINTTNIEFSLSKEIPIRVFTDGSVLNSTAQNGQLSVNLAGSNGSHHSNISNSSGESESHSTKSPASIQSPLPGTFSGSVRIPIGIPFHHNGAVGITQFGASGVNNSLLKSFSSISNTKRSSESDDSEEIYEDIDEDEEPSPLNSLSPLRKTSEYENKQKRRRSRRARNSQMHDVHNEDEDSIDVLTEEELLQIEQELASIISK